MPVCMFWPGVQEVSTVSFIHPVLGPVRHTEAVVRCPVF